MVIKALNWDGSSQQPRALSSLCQQQRQVKAHLPPRRSCYSDTVSRSGHACLTAVVLASTQTTVLKHKEPSAAVNADHAKWIQSSSSSGPEVMRIRLLTSLKSVHHGDMWRLLNHNHIKTEWDSHNEMLFLLDIAFIHLIVQYCLGELEWFI